MRLVFGYDFEIFSHARHMHSELINYYEEQFAINITTYANTSTYIYLCGLFICD